MSEINMMHRIAQYQREMLAVYEYEIESLKKRLEVVEAERDKMAETIRETNEYIAKLEEEMDDDTVNR